MKFRFFFTLMRINLEKGYSTKNNLVVCHTLKLRMLILHKNTTSVIGKCASFTWPKIFTP